MPPPILPYIPPQNPIFVLPPAADIPSENRGEAGNAAAGFYEPPAVSVTSPIPDSEAGEKAGRAGFCARHLCFPKAPWQSDAFCLCWSDIIVYGTALAMVLLGATSMFGSRR